MQRYRKMYIVVLTVIVSLAAFGMVPGAADDTWLSETGETILIGQPDSPDPEIAKNWDETGTQPNPEERSETGAQPDPAEMSLTGSRTESSDSDVNEIQPIPVDDLEFERIPEFGGWTELLEVADPCELVEKEDLEYILGTGIDPEVDLYVDAVEVILQRFPDDPGILQLAACLSGKTEEAILHVLEAMRIDREAVSGDLEEAARNAGLLDQVSADRRSDEPFSDKISAEPVPVPFDDSDGTGAGPGQDLINDSDGTGTGSGPDPFDNSDRTGEGTWSDPFDEKNGTEEDPPFAQNENPDRGVEPFADQTTPADGDYPDGYATDGENPADGGKTTDGENPDDEEKPTDKGDSADDVNEDDTGNPFYSEETLPGETSETTDRTTYETTNETADRTTYETTNETADRTTYETTDGTTNETTDETTDGATDETTNETTAESTVETTNETNENSVVFEGEEEGRESESFLEFALSLFGEDVWADEEPDSYLPEENHPVDSEAVNSQEGYFEAFNLREEYYETPSPQEGYFETDNPREEYYETPSPQEGYSGTDNPREEYSEAASPQEEYCEADDMAQAGTEAAYAGEGGEEEGGEEAGGAGDDHHSGRTIVYMPADRLEDAVAYLSAFVMAEVNDGAGDFDDEMLYTPAGDGYDWKGHDSNNNNGVVRTYDTITYTMSYTTALTTKYKYNTVTGTKLYLEYSLPLSGDEAEFRLDAMSWFLGDGPDGRPVVYYTMADGSETTDPAQASMAVSQRVVGYRALPDHGNGNTSFDVPGAGTVSCVVYVKSAALRQEILPTFKGWLEAATDNTRAPADGTGIVRTLQPDEPVKVTLGAYVSLRYISDSFARTFKKHWTYPYYDGDLQQVTGEGRIKQIRYRITVGKPNGSIKGTSPLAPDRPVKVEFTLDAEATGGKSTTAGLYDLRTADMTVNGGNVAEYAWNGNANSLANVISGEVPVIGMSPFEGCGSLDVGSVSAEDGVYSFCIMPGGNTHPGDIFSGGDILLFSEQADSDPDYSNLQYTVTISTQTLYAVSALDETQSVMPFSQKYYVSGKEVYPFYNITNTLDDDPDTWHAHMYLGKAGQTGGMSGSGMYQTAGRIAYGEKFTLTVQQFFDVNNMNQTEKSRKLFVLWDNNKVEMDVTDGKLSMVDFWDGLSGGAPSDAASALLEGESGSKTRFVFLTKHDGSTWSDENEMDNVDLMSYNDLYMWQTYEEALRHGSICGLLIENYGYDFDIPTQNAALSLTFGMRMKEDPSLIGQSARFTCSIVSYKSNVESTMGGADGTGTLPAGSLRKTWYLSAPRTYCKTEWDEQGRIIPSSLSANNHPHQGTSLYIEGYSMQVQSRILEGGIGSRAHESLVRDLMENNEVTYRVTPGFQSRNGVSGASCRILMPVPDDGNGNRVMHFLRLEALNRSGETEELCTDGTVYSLSDFVSGAEGTFSVTEDDAGQFLNGNEYTGNPLVGRDVVLRPASDPSLALTFDGGATPVLRLYNEGDESQIWRIMRHPAGGYGIVRKAGGEWLTGGKLVPANLAAGQSMTFSTSMDRYDNRFTLTENGDGTWSLLIMGTRLGPGAVRSGSGETAVCLTDADDAASLWTLAFSEKETDGLVIHMDGIADAYALPELYASYSYNKALLNRDSSITQNVYITENDPDIDPASDSHMASTGLGFIEIYASVLMETVDRPEISLSELRKGEEITYTLMYTNIYNKDHAVDLRAPVPGCGDVDGSELAEGSLIQVTDVQVWADGDSSITVNPVEEINRDGQLSAAGVLKSGESVIIIFSITVQGAASGNVIRNSCTQHDAHYTEQSNRVETLITGINDDAFVNKSVDTISNDISETQTWTIESSIPTGLTADRDVLYELRDEIDGGERRLDYRGNLQVTLVNVPGTSSEDITSDFTSDITSDFTSAGTAFEGTSGDDQGNGAAGSSTGAGTGSVTPMVRGTDYTVQEPEEGTAGGILRIRLTKAGLEKLCALDAKSGRLRVSYETSINHTAQAGVHIPNSVTLRYGVTGGGNDAPETENPEPDVFETKNPEPDPYVYTGDISLIKRDRQTMFPLPGVEFALCDIHSASVMQRNGGDFTVTTGDDGRAVFHGLRDGTYLIMETRTDGSHELAASPLRVTVQDGRVPDEAAVHVLNGSALKLNTGGGGVLPLEIAGFILLVFVPLYMKLSKHNMADR